MTKRILKWALLVVVVLAVCGFTAFLYFIPPLTSVAPDEFIKAAAAAAPTVEGIADPAERLIAEHGRELVLAADCAGAEVLTVEGVSVNGELHPVQRALIERGGIQCGFCTPGIVMMSIALLKDNPHPTEDEVRLGLAGNLCRCTGYKKIVEAVMSVENSS